MVTPGTPSNVCSTSLVRLTPDSSCSRGSVKGINKTFLTPCRRVGLKRKSPSCSKNDIFAEQSPHSPLFNQECEQKTKVARSFSEKLVQCNSPRTENEDYFTKKLIYIGKKDCNSSDINEDNHDVKNTDNPQAVCFSKEGGKENNCDVANLSEDAQPKSDRRVKPDFISLELVESLAKSIKLKKENLSHIELSKLYEKKHDLKLLKELTLKWKQGCQAALIEIHSLMSKKGHNLSLSEVISQFQIPYNVIDFNEENDEFELPD